MPHQSNSDYEITLERIHVWTDSAIEQAQQRGHRLEELINILSARVPIVWEDQMEIGGDYLEKVKESTDLADRELKTQEADLRNQMERVNSVKEKLEIWVEGAIG